jgi:membrane fusion protein (multidrug efflux system)
VGARAGQSAGSTQLARRARDGGWFWPVGIGLGLVAAAYSGVSLIRGRHRVTTDNAYVEARISTVSSRVPGSVEEVLVSDNQEVDKGEILLRIDRRDFSAALDQARAVVSIAQGQYDAAALGIPMVHRSVRSQVEEVRSALTGAAEGELKRASAERLRMQKLVENRIVAQEDLDNADAAFKLAQAKVGGIQATLRQVQGRQGEVDVRQAEMKTAAGRLTEALAKQREAEHRLEYTIIRAPFKGRLTRKNVEIGQIVNVGQPLLAVVSTEDVWVIANFKENQLARVRPGQPAVIEVDMYPDLRLEGRVDSIQAGTGSRFALLPIENASGNFVKVVQRIPVKIVLDRGDLAARPLFPGMSVVPTISVDAPPRPRPSRSSGP